jgi:hypothetical protein
MDLFSLGQWPPLVDDGCAWHVRLTSSSWSHIKHHGRYHHSNETHAGRGSSLLNRTSMCVPATLYATERFVSPEINLVVDLRQVSPPSATEAAAVCWLPLTDGGDDAVLHSGTSDLSTRQQLVPSKTAINNTSQYSMCWSAAGAGCQQSLVRHKDIADRIIKQ